MSKRFFFLTTPIFYPNSSPHLGHAYTAVVADFIVRYKKSHGFSVCLQTGSDEHGEKLVKAAIKSGSSLSNLIEENCSLFKKLFSRIGLTKHIFYRTSFSSHVVQVQKIFDLLLKKGEIYLGVYSGGYCFACEEYTLREKNCSVCSLPITEVKEQKTFFLHIAKYSEWLKNVYEKKGFIFPKEIKKVLLNNFVNQNLRDLCVTRNNEQKNGISLVNNSGGEDDTQTIYV